MMNVFNSMDEATATLIIRLQIEDSQDLSAVCEGKGKGREGEVSDTELALRLYREDLERNASIVTDRQMTRSIARACQTDGNALTESRSEEQVAASDREIAGRLGGVAISAPVAPWIITSEEMDEELLAKLAALYVSQPLECPEPTGELLDSESGQPESASCGAGRADQTSMYRKCTACQEQIRFYDTARVPCGHEYCRDCLRALFCASMTDDSLFPPRCCRQPIASGGVRIFLTADLIQQYERKKIEFDTPDRTYCSNELCSAFIRLENITNERGSCPECDTVTCTVCKSTDHTGDCPADTALQQVLQIAEENGWQRCSSCRRLVELNIGCNHMTCLCGSQFCYVCGQRWKTCTCAQWNEDRLIARANQVVARQPEHANPPQQQARVAAVVQNLRNRHNCDHQSWQYVRGRHQCEECYHTLPMYIFECRQCNIQVCNRCRRNRL